jgi:DNA modification methylase
MRLSEQDKKILRECIENDKPIPSQYRNRLFAGDDVEYVEATKDYKLVYQGKARKEDIIANTPAAPLQKICSFNSDNPFEDNWHNMLIFGDNLFALKAIYEDQQGKNVYRTKNKIKLVYIDPPFATKQDFMKDKEKAYRDKIIGAQFIEFLRRRLILLHALLAYNGCIYVHVDQKKGHYIKAVMDEVFGEHFFINEVIWKRRSGILAQSKQYGVNTDSLLFYSKSADFYFIPPTVKAGAEDYVSKRFKYVDEEGRQYRLSPIVSPSYSANLVYEYKGYKPPANGWSCSRTTMEQWEREGKLVFPKKKDGRIQRKQYLDEWEGRPTQTLWEDIPPINPQAIERIQYPTQKPEKLLERILVASSIKGDIILDAFVGSGTTLSVAEKCHRRWIGIDCGKLSIYTSQKRLLNLTTQIGSPKKDDSRDYERINDFEEHSKASRGLFLVYEKARKGDLVITDSFLKNLSKFIEETLSGNARQEFSLICPEEKFKVEKLKVADNEEGKAGGKIVSVGKVNFLISFIQPKKKAEKEQPLRAKEFSLYHAGIYDQQLINELDWETYHPFVAQLFNVRLDRHKIYGFYVDGFIGTYPAYIWPYPEYKDYILDKDYVHGLHKSLGGRAGERLYVIAPVSSMGFMEDEVPHGKTTYVFLKVPLSVLMALVEKGEPGALKQPVSESNVNEVIDAIGFDFISQPVVKAAYRRLKPIDKNLWNQKQKDYVIEIKGFKSNTQVYDPDDFKNFETLSMVLVDCNYNNDYFNLSGVFWSDLILDEDRQKAVIRISQDHFRGKKMMIIFMDKYGNELKVVKTKKDFK